MTIDDVLGLMPIVAHRGWRVSRYGRAIRDHRGYCPLCALSDELGIANCGKTAVTGAADALGISREIAGLVAEAADGKTKYRPALMHALGMSHE